MSRGHILWSILPAGHPQGWENSKFGQFDAVACLSNQKMVINSAELADRHSVEKRGQAINALHGKF